jgi:hypothetical protein
VISNIKRQTHTEHIQGKKTPRKISGHKRKEATKDGGEKWHNEELHNL